ncbi:MAG: hypothetical protein HOP16_12760 [Acidobacteria bacterium]|nr:hypothetical protein [Acidobacteriota bacterium]
MKTIDSCTPEELFAELNVARAAGPPTDTERKRAGTWAKAIDTLFAAGRFEETEHASRLLLQVDPDLAFARSMCGIFDHLPPADGSQTPFADDQTRDVQVVARRDTDVVALLFCGRSHRLGLPLDAMHRWLGRLPASLIYLRDFRKKYFLGGINSLGPTLDATLTELRRTIDQLGARRIVCYGNSSGVFPSLYYGHALGADTIACLAGKTNRTPAFNAFTRDEARAVELAKRFPEATLDTKLLFETMPKPPRILMVYGEHNWSDRRQAEHLGTLPSVTLWPLPDCAEHGAIKEIINRGEYPRVLEWLLHPSED